MKFYKLWFLYIATIFGVLIATIFVYAYTFEGEMNPEIFMKWKVIEGTAKLITPTLATVMVENPDRSAKVKRIQLFIVRYENILTSYRYFKEGEAFYYYLDTEKNKYVRLFYSVGELKGCMECHKDIALHCS